MFNFLNVFRSQSKENTPADNSPVSDELLYGGMAPNEDCLTEEELIELQSESLEANARKMKEAD